LDTSIDTILKVQCLILLALATCSTVARADIYRFVDKDGSTVYTNIARPDRPQVVVVKERHTTVPEEPRNAPLRNFAQKRSRYAGYVQEAALASDVEPALIHAVISAESGYNPSAQSRKGAIGLMQLMPQTARRYSVANPLDPAQNIRGGARYLRDLLRLFNNDLKLVLAAYNAGEESVLKYGYRVPPYAETLAYVPRVMAYYMKYRNSY